MLRWLLGEEAEPYNATNTCYTSPGLPAPSAQLAEPHAWLLFNADRRNNTALTVIGFFVFYFNFRG